MLEKRSEKNRSFFKNFFQKLLQFDFSCAIILSVSGPLVKRLRRSPLKAESWVRFPYGSPKKIGAHSAPIFFYFYPSRRLGMESRVNVYGIAVGVWETDSWLKLIFSSKSIDIEKRLKQG